MQPYVYLQKVGSALDRMDDPDEINRVLDELEFMYEALDPEFQDLVADLIDRLHVKLKEIS